MTSDAFGAWPARAAWVTIGLALIGCGDGAPFEGRELGTAEQELEVCPAGETIDGIDVSYYQGSIDWSAVAGAGKAFAIARINHGDFMDPEFDANWAGIGAAGMVRGAYQYFDAGSDALAQAQIVVDKLGKLGDGDLPAVLDIESPDGQSPATIITALHTWLDHVEAGTGKKPIIYTGKYFWQDYVGTDEFVDYLLWIPNYSYFCPNLPDGTWANWVMHQHSDEGSVPGIGGAVDLNRFNGTLDDLKALVAGGGGYAAEIVETKYPQTMSAGASAKASVVVRNSGGAVWGALTHLGTTEPRDRDSDFEGADWVSPNRAAVVKGEVAAGDTYAFEFTLQAPGEPGVYVEHFGLVEEGVTWFGDDGQGGPPDDAIALEITVVPGGDSSGAGVGGSGSGNSGSGAGADAPKADGGSRSDLEGGVCAVATPGARPRWSAAWIVAAVALAAVGRRSRRRS